MKHIKLFEQFILESAEEKEAKAILQDLLDEYDPWELGDMTEEEAEETVDGYGHKGSKAKKIAKILFGLASSGTFESKVDEAMEIDANYIGSKNDSNKDIMKISELKHLIKKEIQKLNEAPAGESRFAKKYILYWNSPWDHSEKKPILTAASVEELVDKFIPYYASILGKKIPRGYLDRVKDLILNNPEHYFNEISSSFTLKVK